MNKLDKAYNQLLDLSNTVDYHHYMHDKYFAYKQQLKTIDKTLGKEMAHIQDNRTPEQHFMDICRGWLVEDVFAYLFTLQPYKDLTLTFDNHDQDRVIRVMRREITADPDFKITYKNITIRMEAQSMYADMPFFNIKEHKANRLIENDSYLLHLNLAQRHIVLFKPYHIQLGNYGVIEAFSDRSKNILKYGFQYDIDELPEEMIATNFVEELPKKIISLFY
tara:strand:+ start:188 stop:850 length:663 start_codon:yes stop_codon:yes gene_type:complete